MSSECRVLLKRGKRKQGHQRNTCYLCKTCASLFPPIFSGGVIHICTLLVFSPHYTIVVSRILIAVCVKRKKTKTLFELDEEKKRNLMAGYLARLISNDDGSLYLSGRRFFFCLSGRPTSGCLHSAQQRRPDTYWLSDQQQQHKGRKKRTKVLNDTSSLTGKLHTRGSYRDEPETFVHRTVISGKRSVFFFFNISQASDPYNAIFPNNVSLIYKWVILAFFLNGHHQRWIDHHHRGRYKEFCHFLLPFLQWWCLNLYNMMNLCIGYKCEEGERLNFLHKANDSEWPLGMDKENCWCIRQ